MKPDGPDASAPAYLNGVALVTTRLAPSVLLGYLHAIEARHGRQRQERWGDRTLDLDLIAFGDVRSADPRLTLPHPRAVERDFVLAPWLSLDPDAELPGRRPRRCAARTTAGHLVKRTGAGILLVAAALGVAAGFLFDQVLTSTGRPTFTPAVTLPILLVLLGAVVIAARAAHPPRHARSEGRADQSVPRAADRDAREGVEHRRRRDRRRRRSDCCSSC